MAKKIKVALVDDDETMHDILLDLYGDSELIEIKYRYTKSRLFLNDLDTLDFDLCLLDVSMPEVSGITIARQLANRLYIFITGSPDHLNASPGLSPIDVVPKPFSKARLDSALQKAANFYLA